MNYDQIMQNLPQWKLDERKAALRKIKESGKVFPSDLKEHLDDFEFLEKFTRFMEFPNQSNRLSELREKYGRKRK